MNITNDEGLVTVVSTTRDIQYVLLVILALLFRAGFTLVEIGSILTEDVTIIIIRNVVDLAVSLLSFHSIGVMLAFGDKSIHGIIGYWSSMTSHTKYLKHTILGSVSTLMASSIMTSFLSARVHFVGCVFSTFLYSGFCQPLIMHWLWHEKGWMRQIPFLNQENSLRDQGGDLVVHLSSSAAGLVGSIFFGRRLLKLTEIDSCSVGAESSGNSLFGYFLILSGLIGFHFLNLNELEQCNSLVITLINSLTAISTGLITVAILQYTLLEDNFNHWTILKCCQGAISCLVLIANGIKIYTQLVSFSIAITGVVMFYFSTLAIYKTSLEDYCNVISAHFLCGFLGSLLPPIFSRSDCWGTVTNAEQRFIHFIWHLLFSMVTFVFTIFLFTALFFTLNAVGFLRNKYEKISHDRSEKAASRTHPNCFLKKLFDSDDFYIEPGHSGRNLYSLEDNNCLHKMESSTKNRDTSIDMRRPPSKSNHCIAGKSENKMKKRGNFRSVFTISQSNITGNLQTLSDELLNKKKNYSNILNHLETDVSCQSDCNLDEFTKLKRTKKSVNINNHSFSQKANCNVDISPLRIYIDERKDGFIILKPPPSNKEFNVISGE